MMPLARYQEAMARSLLADDPVRACPAELAALFAQPAFAVYRNTVTRGCVDALQANYPAVARLVGEAWFRAAAAIHVRAEPPREAPLVVYGEGFAEFLAQFPPAAELPYLAGVARVERLWTEAHVAADAAPAQAAAIAALSQGQLAHLGLVPHPSARWAWFDAMPIRTIWQRNRARGEGAGPASAADRDEAAAAPEAKRHANDTQHAEEIVWCGEGILLVRPADQVVAHALDAGGCAFLDACARGFALPEAAAAALQAAPQTDLAGLMARLLEAGAFAAPVLREESREIRNDPKEIA